MQLRINSSEPTNDFPISNMGQVYLGTACQTETLSVDGNKVLHLIIELYDRQFFHDL